MLDDPESYLPPAKLPALGDAVNAACDANDGVEDGVLEDPRTCDFDPASLTCPEGTNDTSCLTPKQVAAVKKIWSGSTNSSGDVIYPGLARGAEADPNGWSKWVTGDAAFQSLHWRAGEAFFRNFVFEDQDWDFRSFDFDKDLEFALAKVGQALDSNDPDLRPLRDRGGKLIVYHGWSDPDISPLGAIDYYEKVVAVVGESKRREEAWPRRRTSSVCSWPPGMGTVGAGRDRTGSTRYRRSSNGSNKAPHPRASSRRRLTTTR